MHSSAFYCHFLQMVKPCQTTNQTILELKKTGPIKSLPSSGSRTRPIFTRLNEARRAESRLVAVVWQQVWVSQQLVGSIIYLTSTPGGPPIGLVYYVYNGKPILKRMITGGAPHDLLGSRALCCSSHQACTSERGPFLAALQSLAHPSIRCIDTYLPWI